MAATERIPILVSRAEKAALAKKAKAARLTMGEYLRRAADAYDPWADEVDLEGLIERIRKSTSEASDALGKALKRCAESDSRITAMEARHATRQKNRPGRSA
jgi:hypothetical protein